ncbi:MAG: response regulator [Cyanobacteria bacterium P01_D01_bin.1]
MSKRILVIDDDDGVREIIQISIESTTDWTVWVAASGREGMAIAQSTPPDLILLDVMMPEEDGIAVYKRFQADNLTRSIPAILLTAKTQTSEHQEFMALGVDGIITKPFKATTLVEKIVQIVGW